jgi:hypothetical protein
VSAFPTTRGPTFRPSGFEQAGSQLTVIDGTAFSLIACGSARLSGVTLIVGQRQVPPSYDITIVTFKVTDNLRGLGAARAHHPEDDIERSGRRAFACGCAAIRAHLCWLRKNKP